MHGSREEAWQGIIDMHIRQAIERDGRVTSTEANRIAEACHIRLPAVQRAISRFEAERKEAA